MVHRFCFRAREAIRGVHRTFVPCALFFLISWLFPWRGNRAHVTHISKGTAKKPRILLTDMMFPNARAKWRLLETLAFIEEFEADIMVVAHVAPSLFSFDWVELQESHHLDRYDLLIFNPTFNQHDVFNNLPGNPSPIDGISFNRKEPIDYLLRHKRHRGTPVDIGAYDAVHHIFVINYMHFCGRYPWFPPQKQSIHLYPGGGFVAKAKAGDYGVDPAVLLIPTQSFIVDYVRQYMPNNPVLPVVGSPFLYRGAQPVRKLLKAHSDALVACFTSLGDHIEKGADLYVKIAELYRQRYPNTSVQFYGIGNVLHSPAIRALPAMSQAKLDDFYTNTVDVYFNLERTDGVHGWPLGVEAMVAGAVLFTTDKYDMNTRNNFRFTEDEVSIVIENEEEQAVAKLRQLDMNRTYLQQQSVRGQNRAFDLWSYDSMLRPITKAVWKNANGP